VARQVDAARYGGGDAQAGVLRDALMSALGPSGGPVKGAAAKAWALCGIAIVVAAAVLVPSLPRSGDPAAAQLALRADRTVTGGDVDAAARAWRTLWTRGGRASGIAARLAWASARTGALADASAWVLRGDTGQPRDPALSWVTGNVRDAGGLAGFKHSRIPIRDVEWALAALACGIGLGWVGRRGAIALVALAALLAAAPVLDRMRAGRVVRGVVRQPVVLQGEGVELVPGQVVVVTSGGPTVAVEVGSGIHGRLPAPAVEIVAPR
jgi:hypothetical protein